MKITRNNWREHVTEPNLTGEEWRQVHAMRHACREDRVLGIAVYEAVKAELATVQAMTETQTADWSDIVAWTDAQRRLLRAEVQAWLETQR